MTSLNRIDDLIGVCKSNINYSDEKNKIVKLASSQESLTQTSEQMQIDLKSNNCITIII